MAGFSRKNKHLAVVAVLVFTNIFIWSAVSAREASGRMTVAFLDVGQGDSIFIESPSGVQMIVDGGPNRTVLSRLSEIMPFFDRSIDIVLATHPDKDHIGGLIDVLDRYSVAYVVMTEAVSETAVFREFVRAVEQSGAAIINPRRGMVIDLGGGAGFKVFFPDRSMADISDKNDGSIIGQVGYGNEEFFLTGDAPQAVERYLVSLDGENLASEVLKAGHHGSKTSSAPEFVAAVAPAYAIISAGKDNQYGHPNKETLDTLETVGAEILRTDELGAIIFKTDGETLEISHKK